MWDWANRSETRQSIHLIKRLARKTTAKIDEMITTVVEQQVKNQLLVFWVSSDVTPLH